MPACDASRNARQYKAAVSRRFRWRRRVDHALAHRLTGVELVLIGNDYMIAVSETTERLRKIKCAKSHVDCSSLHDSPIYHERLIDKQRACWYEHRIFMCAGNDVHFSSHPDHHVVGWIFHLQHNGIALGG